MKSLINSEAMREQFAKALPRHLTVDRFTRIAITALSRTPKLASCTPASLMKCLLDLSAMGLEPDGRRAHLIPFENKKAGTVECTLIVDFKGMVDLVRRDPNVIDVQAYTIREKDSIIIRNGIPDHSFNPIEERGKVKAVYTKIVWKSGQTTYGEPMPWSECESVRNRSKAWQGWLSYKRECPWNTDEVEMWKKTVIRRDSKMWPLSPDIRDAIEKDDEHGFAFARDVTPRRELTGGENPFVKQVLPEVVETDANGIPFVEPPVEGGEA